jgi:hypothetical protein
MGAVGWGREISSCAFSRNGNIVSRMKIERLIVVTFLFVSPFS